MTSLAVVVPLYDKASYIGDAIASLAAQSAPPEQLIVVDDASTDGSVAALEAALDRHAGALRATRTEIVRRARNGGPGAARNDGIARVDSDVVLCLDADDALHAGALQLVRESMERHRLAMLVLGYASDPPGEAFPDLGLLAGELEPLAPDVYRLIDPPRAAAHPEFVMGRASNVAVQRSCLGTLRYDAHARLNEGVDLWYRVLKAASDDGEIVALCAEPLIRFRITSASLSHARPTDWRALAIPPSLARYRASGDARDRALAAMLAERWLAHARATLPHAQAAEFIAHHRALLAEFGIAC